MATKGKLKIFSPLLIIAVVVIIITAGATYLFFKSALDSIESDSIEAISTIAATIEPEDIYALNGDLSDLDNPAYIEEKAVFERIIEVNDEFVFLYLMGVYDENKHEMFFYIDYDNTDAQALPGEIYKDTTSKMLKTIETGESQFDHLNDGEDTDEWGTWISAYAPIKDEDGKVIAMLGIDIDQNKYLFDIIVKTSPPILIALIFASVLFFYHINTKRNRQQVEREKDLLSVASHEIRSPLISIKWVLDDMAQHPEDYELSDKTKNLIAAVSNNSSKLISNVNSILNSVPNKSMGKKNSDRINVLAMFKDLIDTLHLVAKEHQATIRIDESIAEDITITGNAHDLKHAFFNVLTNALKYTNPNTEVVISYIKSGSFDQIRVSDHGPGVKPADREKIFEGMYRTDEALASKQPGTGLGLYFVKKVIDNHHGKIYVDPDYTDGTSFIIELPE